MKLFNKIENFKYFAFLIIFSSILAGCSEVIRVKVPEAVPVIIHKPTRPAELNPREVKFIVVSQKYNNKEIQNESAYIAMTIKDYENLAMNYQEIINYIEKQKNIILYYENSADYYRNKK